MAQQEEGVMNVADPEQHQPHYKPFADDNNALADRFNRQLIIDNSDCMVNSEAVLEYMRLRAAKQEDRVESPTLQNIAPEIRNLIFEMVLVEEDMVCVGADCEQLPGLLAVCRQFREETMPVFCLRNRFALVIQHYDTQALIHIYRTIMTHTMKKLADQSQAHVRPASMKGGIVLVKSFGDPNWTNLAIWLKRFHDGQMAGTMVVTENEQDRNLVNVASTFKLVAALADVGTRWSQIELLLEHQRKLVLGNTDHRWLEP